MSPCQRCQLRVPSEAVWGQSGQRGPLGLALAAGEWEKRGGWRKNGWSSWLLCSRVYRRPLQTWIDIYRCRCDLGRGATFVPSAVIPVTCRYGVLPGKSSGAKNNWGIADGVPSLHVFVELARRLTAAGPAAACGWLLSCPAGQGQESAGLLTRTWRSQHLGVAPRFHCHSC